MTKAHSHPYPRSVRIAAAGIATLVLMAGCGNRTGSTGKSDGVDTTTASQTGDTSQASGDTFGTLSTPCGTGDATGATDKGVTATTIKIGVISDKNAGAIRVPTAGVESSMQAFVSYCNDLGGINGRRLELKTYDAQLLKSAEAAKQACDDQPFALVGNGVVQDAPMAQPLVNCGLVSVSGYTATYSMTASPYNVSPIPNPGNLYATGAAKYFAQKYPEAIKKSAIFAPTTAAAADQAKRAVMAREKLGYKFIYNNSYNLIQTDWKTQVQTLKNKGVQYVTIVDTVNAAIGMLQAMNDADYHPQVIDLGQQYYDSTLAASGLADGVFVQTNTQPFEYPSTAITQYVDILHKNDKTAPVTSLGVQSFSAALMFATVVKEMGSDVTRKGLLAGLHKVTTWNGGGLHPTMNPGENEPNTCTLILKVEGGKFVSEYPKGTATDPDKAFDCNPKAVAEVKGNWGAVPTVP